MDCVFSGVKHSTCCHMLCNKLRTFGKDFKIVQKFKLNVKYYSKSAQYGDFGLQYLSRASPLLFLGLKKNATVGGKEIRGPQLDPTNQPPMQVDHNWIPLQSFPYIDGRFLFFSFFIIFCLFLPILTRSPHAQRSSSTNLKLHFVSFLIRSFMKLVGK